MERNEVVRTVETNLNCMKKNNASGITVTNNSDKKPTYSEIVKSKMGTVAMNTRVKGMKHMGQ